MVALEFCRLAHQFAGAADGRSASAGLVAYEPFDYASGQILNTASSLWTLNGTTANDTTVTSGSLGIPGLQESIGNSIEHGGVGAAVRYTFASPIIDGTLYYSFAFKMNSLGAFTAVNSFMSAFVDSSGAYEGRLMARTNTVAGQYNLGITKITGTVGTPVWAPNDFNEGETNFIVVRYTFNGRNHY